jgi:hypothetical protein
MNDFNLAMQKVVTVATGGTDSISLAVEEVKKGIKGKLLLVCKSLG